jgi:glycosyltransferase involved in cell wall biosynthesis
MPDTRRQQTELDALRVSLVICSYSMERLTDIDRCIQSVGEQRRQPDETILVVDHNSELLEEAHRRFPGVTVVPSDRRQGASGARNCGVQHATGEIVAFLDDDTSADKEWLAELVQPYADARVLGTTGKVVANWPTERPYWFPPEFDWVVGCTYRGMPETMGPIRNLWGPMSFRKAVVEDVGAFDESIGLVGRNGMGCEETELSLRIRAGHPEGIFLFVPSAETKHNIDRNRTRVRYFLRRCFGEGVSKAYVASSVGSESALASERTYAFHALPAALTGSLKRCLRGQFRSVFSATMVVLGLTTTVSGYVYGRAFSTSSSATGKRWSDLASRFTQALRLTEQRLRSRVSTPRAR